MKRVSIKDVALKAGVSTALVSYVLNGRHTDRISKLTAEKIKNAAKELNYRPNSIARSLKAKKTHTIALLVADIANPFASQIARIIEDEISNKGYVILIGSSDENAEKLQQLIDIFLTRQVDGFIILPVEGSEKYILDLAKTNAPIVLIDRYFTNNMEIPVITTNNYGASYQATEHLIKKGKKNIGILSFQTELIHINERVNGYKRAVLDRGLTIKSENIKYINEAKIDIEVSHAIDELLSKEEPIDALFFATNKLALAGLKKLMTLTIRIPEELALITFDESEAFDIFKVPVSHIKQPLYEISKEAVEIITGMIEDKNLKFKPRVYNSKLIIKQSS
ncbi:LacI family DNA-binding transcriptional regulator [Apibacter sp. wkB309]|uniref:LacI family DNA-binding transcriptional regulator n=1 Tax=Apibacter sp. wkB309 TaxID=1679467 RepID=UPI000CF854B6|nr:substrate-binding domain-containing protein [Apibacter sp. wkB309]PQL92885.1 LacI family transcriptional regulator [Apibacter sp. wkB309]